MRINTKPRRQNSRRAAKARSCPAHLQWLRGRACCLAGQGCGGKIEAAHVDRAGGKGIALKVSDFAAVPLCHDHHAEYHDRGALTFEARYDVDLVEVAAAYANRSPARFRHERRQRQAVRA